MGDIGDSLPRASDRYTYTVSVPNMYHSLGREGMQSLREEVGREWAQEWEQAMHRLGEMLKQPVLLSERLTISANTRKQKQTGILLGAHLGGVLWQ